MKRKNTDCVRWVLLCCIGSLVLLNGDGGLDFLLHSIAFAPKEDLHGRVVDCSAEGFAMAMDISCHSFARFARLAEPMMTGGGTLSNANDITLSGIISSTCFAGRETNDFRRSIARSTSCSPEKARRRTPSPCGAARRPARSATAISSCPRTAWICRFMACTSAMDAKSKYLRQMKGRSSFRKFSPSVRSPAIGLALMKAARSQFCPRLS